MERVRAHAKMAREQEWRVTRHSTGDDAKPGGEQRCFQNTLEMEPIGLAAEREVLQAAGAALKVCVAR